MALFKVLSIDGGGIRGVIPAVLLEHIEKQTKQRVADLFDLIVGTSTGGIIAAALTCGGEDQERRMSAGSLVKLYTERGREIFPQSAWRGLRSLFDERYDDAGLKAILHEKLGDAQLSDCEPPIVVTSYDIEKRRPYFFKTTKAKSDDLTATEDPADRNHYLRDVARATSAGPTYFEPAVVGSMATTPTRRVLVDGGVFVNNPAMCAYVEARRAFRKNPEDILLVSLGTGDGSRKIKFDEAKDWGAISWIQPLIGIMMDGSADAVDYHLRLLMPDDTADDQRYFRLTTKLDYGKDDLDDVSDSNIRNLKERARHILNKERTQITRLLTILREESGTRTANRGRRE